MRHVVALLIGLFLIGEGCVSSRQHYAEVREMYPTFYIGEYSWDAMIFKDTTLYGQGFSDLGGMLSDIYRMGNWRFIDDGTIECYNLRKRKKTDSGFQIYHLDRIDTLTQLLIPNQSLAYYRDHLQANFRTWIATNPYQPEADEVLIQLDSVRFYALMLQNHRENLVRKYASKFNDLKIYQGKGF